MRSVLQKRGQQKMTAPKARAMVPGVRRQVGTRTVQRRLREAALRWLRRRALPADGGQGA